MYIEHNNMIFRGEVSPITKRPEMTEAIIAGQWQPASSQTMMDAGFYGTKMSESQAKEFQGDGWPADTAEPTEPPA